MASAFPVEEKEEPAPFEFTQTTNPDGTYTFTYSTPEESRTETRTKDGEVQGAYSYIDSNGELQKATYTSGEGGFQLYSSNLPVATKGVDLTPEVKAAIAEHDAAIRKHLIDHEIAAAAEAEFRRLHPELEEEYAIVEHTLPETRDEVFEIPQEVEEDEEVKIARALHYAEVQKRIAELEEAYRNAPKLEEGEHHFVPVQHNVPEFHYGDVPEDEEDVKIAKREFFALFDSLRKAHLEAHATTPKFEEQHF